MSELLKKLESARAEVARLERIAATATCREIGCDMQSIGGANCGCIFYDGEDRCEGQCSIPVLKCTRCGDCDYGENAEAEEKRASCLSEMPWATEYPCCHLPVAENHP